MQLRNLSIANDHAKLSLNLLILCSDAACGMELGGYMPKLQRRVVTSHATVMQQKDGVT
jgi:hypothetical protein